MTSASSGRRVLLAEDDRINVMVASAILESAGFEITVAGDGEKAALLAARNVYDVILMDLEMPVMGGLESTRRIRAGAPPGRDVPIIGLSAHNDPAAERACLAAGMNGYVSKPVSRAALLGALDKALESAGRRRRL